MDVDASERRKTKIYAGKKKKSAMKDFSPIPYTQSECCGRGFGHREFLFTNYVSVNNKYARGKNS